MPMHNERGGGAREPAEPITILLAGRVSDDGPGLLRHLLPPFALGPETHSHQGRREVCYVLEGVLAFRLGEEALVLQAGELLIVPAGREHTYWNPTASLTRLLLIYAPGGAAETLYDLARGEPGPDHWLPDTS
jgi:mannose-6-phosphate isomerase-like protein (cupin superfamily)